MTSDDVMKGSTTFTMLSTTTAFRDKNPKAVAAVLAALEESTRMIREDHKMAADVLLSSTTESGFSAEELMDVIGDPAVKFTTTPENVMKYAEFMHSVGTIKTLPASWKDLFFQEIHGAPGNLIPPLLRVEDVTLQYDTGYRLIRAAYRVSFDVLRSDRFVILGPSGCGKSTILKAVGGYVHPVEGRILLEWRAGQRAGARPRLCVSGVRPASSVENRSRQHRVRADRGQGSQPQ